MYMGLLRIFIIFFLLDFDFFFIFNFYSWLVGILRRSDVFRLNQFYIEMTHDFCYLIL